MPEIKPQASSLKPHLGGREFLVPHSSFAKASLTPRERRSTMWNMRHTNGKGNHTIADHDMTRREAIAVGTAAAVAATAARTVPAKTSGAGSQPVAVSSFNGVEAVRRTVERMEAGVSPVEAAIYGVSVVEADPDDYTVGYGGLPNSEGVVQLDACCMDGPTMRAGAVAALEGYMHPAQVAYEIMRRTTRVMLVADGAAQFAKSLGFREENLLTERARKIWLYWKGQMSGVDDWMTPPDLLEDPDVQRFIKEEGPIRPTGTINLCAVDGNGDLGGTTTTSGLFFKIPGRVGDSPLIGAGLFVDNEVGAAGSTGRGESVIQISGAHTVVELMRAKHSPRDACLGALDRLVRATRVPYLLDGDGRPNFDVKFYAVNRAGEAAGAAIWAGSEYALCRGGEEARLMDCASLYPTTAPWKKA
jgi:N4-(beta-N-acetylglucosaminyl)-L-asparaginase